MCEQEAAMARAMPGGPCEGEGIPVGYKRTEVGVIPEDWESKTIHEVAPLQRGFDLPASHIRIGVHPVVYSNGILEHHSYALVKGPGVVTGRSGTIGKVHFVEADYWPHNTSLWVTSYRGNDPKFVYYLYSHIDFARFLSGSGVPTLNRNDIHKHRVPVPPPYEQCAIAEALSDVDGLLKALDALIAKKRAVKQATMQQLLTGKTRLPGFGRRKWTPRRLGHHVTFLRNGTNSRSELTSDGPVKYLHYGDIHASSSVYLDPLTAAMPAVPPECAASLDRLENGDLVMVDASEDLEGVGTSVEVKDLRDLKLVAGLHTIAARFDKSVLADGFKGYLPFCPELRTHLRRLAAGTKVYATSRTHLASAEIRLPDSNEQHAIATVLSDMDAETAALEQRRDKTRAIKQGMMQQLLTGRVRLVKSGAGSTRGKPRSSRRKRDLTEEVRPGIAVQRPRGAAS